MTTTKAYRYHLPAKAIKGDCPECGHRKTLSRYVDTQTGDLLPETYGRCDRESNCSYHLSPYHKGSSGLSYHDEQKALESIGPIPKTWFQLAGSLKRKGHVDRPGVILQLIQQEGATVEQAEKVAAYIFDQPDHSSATAKATSSVVTIPDEVFQASIGHYEHNQLARLLIRHVGTEAAQILLQQFQIGSSSRWPGACVFWYIDAIGRIRGGQIKLFGDDFHTVKYVDQEGKTRSKTSWVHSALIRKYTQKQQSVPDWLTEYDKQADRSPCLFGLPQLQTAPIDQPIAIVEAPKTAILCSHYFPDFIWMAVGSKSYLNANRLAPIRGRKVTLFPDLNAYYDLVNEKGQTNKGWLSKATELQANGFDLSVSDYLEKSATEEDKAKGLDLADYLLSLSVDPLTAEPEPIQPAVIPQTEENAQPSERKPVRIPALIETYWQMFSRPPMWYNLIAAHKSILRCLEPNEPEQVVTSIAEQLKNPGSIIRPTESQLERLSEAQEEVYPESWDHPSPDDALPVIKPMSFFEWQRSHESPFSQLGLNSINYKQP